MFTGDFFSDLLPYFTLPCRELKGQTLVEFFQYPGSLKWTIGCWTGNCRITTWRENQLNRHRLVPFETLTGRFQYRPARRTVNAMQRGEKIIQSEFGQQFTRHRIFFRFQSVQNLTHAFTNTPRRNTLRGRVNRNYLP